MKGQVVKIISENFYVNIDSEIIICKQRGKLKNLKTLPLVGDFVLVDKEKQVIEAILPRKNMIIRPNVSNVTMAFVITSFKNPDFSTNLLDKLLVQLEINNIKPVICLTKRDLISDLEFLNYKKILDYYQEIGYIVIYNHELEKIKDILKDNTTVFIGQTGAGKSTLLNKLFDDLNLKTGEVSIALGRGRHTTRHVEIIEIDSIKVLDTPGFSALSFLNYSETDVRDAFLEFQKFPCLYHDCMHIRELECKVKEAVNNNQILLSRYENYQTFIEEFKLKKRW